MIWNLPWLLHPSLSREVLDRVASHLRGPSLIQSTNLELVACKRKCPAWAGLERRRDASKSPQPETLQVWFCFLILLYSVWSWISFYRRYDGSTMTPMRISWRGCWSSWREALTRQRETDLGEQLHPLCLRGQNPLAWSTVLNQLSLWPPSLTFKYLILSPRSKSSERRCLCRIPPG